MFHVFSGRSLRRVLEAQLGALLPHGVHARAINAHSSDQKGQDEYEGMEHVVHEEAVEKKGNRQEGTEEHEVAAVEEWHALHAPGIHAEGGERVDGVGGAEEHGLGDRVHVTLLG
eukprot:11985742-Alexandrium_andersonii.AAC.1